uniref:Uncharacterized protein n=1 Tax=Arundo donax TaxID=35708 RepID=A0A0A9G050_ARUDO
MLCTGVPSSTSARNSNGSEN